MGFLDDIEPLKQAALAELNAAADLPGLDAAKGAWVGPHGKFTALMKQLGTLSKEEKPAAGKLINAAKVELETALIARRMVGRRIERVEAMILILDLRPVGDGEADLAEGTDDVVGDLREWMQLAERAAASGQGEVGWMLGHRGGEFEFTTTFGERSFEFDLGDVDEFAGGGLLFLRERAELFHQRGEPAVRSDPRALGLFQCSEVGSGFEFRERGLFQRFDFVKESSHK